MTDTPQATVPLKFHIDQLGIHSWVEVDNRLITRLRDFTIHTRYGDATELSISGILDNAEPIDITGYITITSRDNHQPQFPPAAAPFGPRLFYLNRLADVSGVSGIGPVAEGIEFTDGRVALRWRGTHRSTVMYDSIQDVIAIHGHQGSTEVVWLT